MTVVLKYLDRPGLTNDPSSQGNIFSLPDISRLMLNKTKTVFGKLGAVFLCLFDSHNFGYVKLVFMLFVDLQFATHGSLILTASSPDCTSMPW